MHVFAVLAILAIILSLSINKKFVPGIYQGVNLFTVFSILWLAILILGEFKAYDMFGASAHFYYLLFLGILFWMIGYFLSVFSSKVKNYNIKIGTNNYNPVSKTIKFDFNIKVIYAIQIISLVFVTIILIRMILFTHEGLSLDKIRSIYLGRSEESFFTSPVMNLLNNKLVSPCLYALVPISIIMFFEKKHLKACMLSMLIFIIYEVGVGGRFLLIYIIVEFLLALVLYKEILAKTLGSPKKVRKIRRRIFFIVVIAVIIMLVITIVKKQYHITGEYSKVFMSYYTYATLCLPLGDYWIDYMEANNLYTYGSTFSYGLLSSVDFIVNKTGFHYLTELTSYVSGIVNMTEEYYINVGIGHNSNAFVTWVYFFYLDFREAGVAVGSTIFGSLAGLLTKYAFKKRTLFNYAFYLLFAQCIIKSFVRWELYLSSYLLAFLYLRMMLQKTYVTKNENTESHIL